MIIVDQYLQKLEKQGRKIRVGLWGAGEMAKGLVNQVMRYTPGMEITVIANRTLSKAIDAYTYTGREAVVCDTLTQLQQCIDNNQLAVTEHADLLCEVNGLDILVECTGTIHHAAQLILNAIHNKKNVLMFNPEVDATIGPILKKYADKQGVLLSGCDGDQPGVIMNLYRFVKGIGMTPLLCGNIKGLQDFYRNPTTQAGFAARWQLTPEMVTQFADGTKISFEQTCVANATGMRLLKRGMTGIHYDGHIDDMVKFYDVEELKAKGGVVDYVVGPKPGPGVFVFATTDDPKTKHYMDYGKLGTGPLYSFYTPYHLIYFEIPFSIARMVLFNDTIMTPIEGPVVEVITHAKTSLLAGKKLDGLGGYDTYGQCEESVIVQRDNLLPIGLAEGAIVKRDLPRDHVLTFDDVIMPDDNLVQQLYREQCQHFFADYSEPLELMK
jgi:predicted homoserine dehydrogenase-like protein